MGSRASVVCFTPSDRFRVDVVCQGEDGLCWWNPLPEPVRQRVVVCCGVFLLLLLVLLLLLLYMGRGVPLRRPTAPKAEYDAKWRNVRNYF